LWPKVAELAVAERSTWLSQQQAEVRAARDRIDQEALAYRQALAGRDAAAAKREQALKTDAVAAESERAAEAEHTAAAAAVTSATDQCAVLQSQREHVHHELDGAFPSTAWRERFAEDARRFVAACLQEAETWQAQAALLTEHKAEQAKVDVAVQGLAATVTAAVARTGEAERRGRDETARFLTLQQERARLFEGRAVAAVEAGLQADLAAAKANTEQRDRLARQSADERARCEAALASAQTELLAQRSACVDAEAQVTTWLSAFNAQHAPTPPLTLDTLRELLSHDDAWKKAEREALAALEAGVAAASAVLGERAARREVLAGERLSEASQSEVEAAWSNGKDGLGQARALLTRLEVEVQADNDRRAERQNLERQVTAQGERAALWARVNDLIGSADGKKLRNFAQELTLDVLLCYANRHLEVLARRYRLLRVQGTLGLLVNDDDMGGEVRSTRSLSGGETFLVSLSLALGLASLSSHRVRVESLFIDEGFGSLDADTLAVAMDALDRLHAQGRRVCVISHVQEMTERIAVRIHIQKGTGGKSELVLID
jgi:exonuclease SbcC